MFIEGVVIVVDAKWWSLIVETESIYSSDIPDTICDRQVNGLGGVSFVELALLAFTFLWCFPWLNRELRSLCFDFVVSYHVEVSSKFLNVDSPSMPAKSP